MHDGTVQRIAKGACLKNKHSDKAEGSTDPESALGGGLTPRAGSRTQRIEARLLLIAQ
jgi:hypothetical protein